MNSGLPANFPAKLGAWDPVGGWSPVRYENIFQRETISGVHRILIATREDAINVLMELLNKYQGPFRLVYLLITPPQGYDPTRYELTDLSADDISALLIRFRTFLQTDARHHIWIHAATSGGTLIYDEHDWIYCYGQGEAVLSYLNENDFKEKKPEIPFPHLHNEDSSNDETMVELLASYPWVKSIVSNLA